jgi:hypothetical protein
VVQQRGSSADHLEARALSDAELNEPRPEDYVPVGTPVDLDN